MNIKEKIQHLKNDELNNEEVDTNYVDACNYLTARKYNSEASRLLNLAKSLCQINEDLTHYDWKE